MGLSPQLVSRPQPFIQHRHQEQGLLLLLMVCLWLVFIMLIRHSSLMRLLVVRVRMLCDTDLSCLRLFFFFFQFNSLYSGGCGHWEAGKEQGKVRDVHDV